MASHNYKFHSDTSSVSKDHRSFDTVSIDSDGGSVSSGSPVSLALRELRELVKSMQQRNEIQDDKLRDLDNKIFSMECNKGSALDTKISSNYDNTNELKWETKRQSERIGNLERKIKVLEESLNEEMDQSSVEIMEDATNIQQLFHDNNVGAIKTQIVALKNGVLLLLNNFDHTPDIESLLRELYDASFEETQEILVRNFSAIQKAFTSVSFAPEIKSQTESEEDEEEEEEEEEEDKAEKDDGSSSEENERKNEDYESAEDTQSEYLTTKETESEDSN